MLSVACPRTARGHHGHQTTGPAWRRARSRSEGCVLPELVALGGMKSLGCVTMRHRGQGSDPFGDVAPAKPL